VSVPVREVATALGDALKLRLVAGSAGLGRTIDAPRVQKPALALAGYLDQIHPGRIQVLGNAEVGYIERLRGDAAVRAVDAVCRAPVACFVVANAERAPQALRRGAARHRVPLFVTSLRTSATIRGLTRWLEERFAPETSIHGVLLDVLGLGVLLVGKSGVGKSEAALALILRGHRLIADDVVRVREAPPGTLKGRCAERLRHHIEIRGLGVLNIAELFGVLATTDEMHIDLVLELVDQRSQTAPDRLGIAETRFALLGFDLPHRQVQVRPGRDLATIIEVAARSQLLKQRGFHAARRFAATLDRDLRKRAVR